MEPEWVVGDTLCPDPKWNKREPDLMLPETVEVLDVRRGCLGVNQMVKVRTIKGDEIWIKASWLRTKRTAPASC